MKRLALKVIQHIILTCNFFVKALKTMFLTKGIRPICGFAYFKEIWSVYTCFFAKEKLL